MSCASRKASKPQRANHGDGARRKVLPGPDASVWARGQRTRWSVPSPTKRTREKIPFLVEGGKSAAGNLTRATSCKRKFPKPKAAGGEFGNCSWTVNAKSARVTRNLIPRIRFTEDGPPPRGTASPDALQYKSGTFRHHWAKPQEAEVFLTVPLGLERHRPDQIDRRKPPPYHPGGQGPGCCLACLTCTSSTRFT